MHAGLQLYIAIRLMLTFRNLSPSCPRLSTITMEGPFSVFIAPVYTLLDRLQRRDGDGCVHRHFKLHWKSFELLTMSITYTL